MDKENTWARYKEVKGYQCINDAGDKKVFRNLKAIEGYNTMHHDNFKRMPLIDPKTGKQKIARRNEKQWVRVKMEDNPLNNRESLKFWRKQWEVIANKYLPEDRQISCESYEKRGINKKATIHLGGKANRIKERSYRYKQNEAIKELNETNNMSVDNILDLVDSVLGDEFEIPKPRHVAGLNSVVNEREREAMRGIYGDDDIVDKEID